LIYSTSWRTDINNDDVGDAWIIDWSFLGIDLPVIAVPQQRLPTELDLLDFSVDPKAEAPFTEAYGFCFPNEATVVLCEVEPVPGTATSQLRPAASFNLAGPARDGWDLDLIQIGYVLLCAYSDVFLMSYVAEQKPTDSATFRRLRRCTAMGVARTYSILSTEGVTNG